MEGIKDFVAVKGEKADRTNLVQSILRLAKSAGMESTLNKLTFVLNSLDPELCSFISMPMEATTASAFIQG